MIGPAAGGLITDYASWRWVFYVNVPFGLAAAVLLALTLTENFERRRSRPDYLGVSLLTGGLIAVLLALLGQGGAPSLSGGTLALFFGGLAALGLFVVVERRAEDPVVPPILFGTGCSGSRCSATSPSAACSSGSRSTCRCSCRGAGRDGGDGGGGRRAALGGMAARIGGRGRMILRRGYRGALLLGAAFVAAGGALCVPMDRGRPSCTSSSRCS
ncbi:MFS transporter [Rubrobacter marinus]|uniref:MFS transporter n=1 Tax=Rubrobacter marinus TaxID=2653852 RepID=UPI001408A187|nr:MFS transporter [Rubrobacter marinus]